MHGVGEQPWEAGCFSNHFPPGGGPSVAVIWLGDRFARLWSLGPVGNFKSLLDLCHLAWALPMFMGHLKALVQSTPHEG